MGCWLSFLAISALLRPPLLNAHAASPDTTLSLTQVALATGAACILNVSAIVMGVLVLAVGTSVPDMIGSMIAAKNGEASVRNPSISAPSALPSPEQVLLR